MPRRSRVGCVPPVPCPPSMRVASSCARNDCNLVGLLGTLDPGIHQPKRAVGWNRSTSRPASTSTGWPMSDPDAYWVYSTFPAPPVPAPASAFQAPGPRQYRCVPVPASRFPARGIQLRAGWSSVPLSAVLLVLGQQRIEIRLPTRVTKVCSIALKRRIGIFACAGLRYTCAEIGRYRGRRTESVWLPP